MNYTNTLKGLILEYEDMSQKGTVVFFEETVYLKLIDYYFKNNDFEKALVVVNHAIEQHGHSNVFYNRKASILLNLDKSQQALEIIEATESLYPDCLETTLLRIEYLCMHEQTNEAFELIEDVKENVCSTKNMSFLFGMEALVYEYLGDYDKMFDALRNQLLLDNTNDKAFHKIWMCVEISGKYEKSIRFHQQLINKNPYTAYAWFNLGHANYCVESFTEAAECFEYAFLIDREFVNAYMECADTYIHIKQYEKAINCLIDLEDVFVFDSLAYTKLGICHFYLNNFDLALDALNKAILLDFTNDVAYYHLALLKMKVGDAEDAISMFEQAIVINDNLEEYYIGYAKALESVGRNLDAKRNYVIATETAPEIKEIWIEYLQFLLRRKRFKTILTVIDEAEMYALCTELLYFRAICLFYQNQKSQALDMLNEALLEDGAFAYLIKDAKKMYQDKDITALLSLYKS
ncbi:MAG: hypothetical protein IPL95_00605 [Saprospiraceae bacterium]|nr:hypothetical protein [Saprospiraceae bacterium]